MMVKKGIRVCTRLENGYKSQLLYTKCTKTVAVFVTNQSKGSFHEMGQKKAKKLLTNGFLGRIMWEHDK